jgi:hypothetical protein
MRVQLQAGRTYLVKFPYAVNRDIGRQRVIYCAGVKTYGSAVTSYQVFLLKWNGQCYECGRFDRTALSPAELSKASVCADFPVIEHRDKIFGGHEVSVFKFCRHCRKKIGYYASQCPECDCSYP